MLKNSNDILMGQDFRKEFALILEIDVNDLHDNTWIHNGDGWDSINLLATVALIDKYFQIILNLDLLQKTSTFLELKVAIKDAMLNSQENHSTSQPPLTLVS